MIVLSCKENLVEIITVPLFRGSQALDFCDVAVLIIDCI